MFLPINAYLQLVHSDAVAPKQPPLHSGEHGAHSDGVVRLKG